MSVAQRVNSVESIKEVLFSGKNVDCALKKQGNHPEQSQYNQNYVALGRCSTSGDHVSDVSGGHCESKQVKDRSHGAWCCQTDGKKQMNTCGWIYASFGVKTECPKDHAAAGFCGTNSLGECPGGNWYGVQCCKFTK